MSSRLKLNYTAGKCDSSLLTSGCVRACFGYHLIYSIFKVQMRIPYNICTTLDVLYSYLNKVEPVNPTQIWDWTKKSLLLNSVGLDAFWIIKLSWTPVRFSNCQVNTLSKTFTKIWVSATFAARFSEQSSEELANCQSLSQPIYSILHYGNLTVVLSVDYTGTRSFLIYILRTLTHTHWFELFPIHKESWTSSEAIP